MSGLICAASAIKRCLSDIASLFPKGVSSIPIALNVSNGYLTITCVTGASYQADIEVNDREHEYHATVLFRNVTNLISQSGECVLTFSNYNVTLFNNDFEIVLLNAYSPVEQLTLPEVPFVPCSAEGYKSGLKSLLGLNLSAIYRSDRPIEIFGDVSVIKYPSMHAQARTNGISDITASVTPEHANLIANFGAQEYYQDSDCLWFRRSGAWLQVPYNAINDENDFLKLLDGMDNFITLNTNGYLDKLRLIAKLNAKERCNVVLCEEGIKTSMQTDNASTSASIGKIDERVLAYFSLPITIWIQIMKALNGGTAQFAAEGNRLCARSNTLIIVLSVLS